MKKIMIASLMLSIIFTIIIVFTSCSSSENTTINKSGAQLWGESCVRCHNAPSPKTFSDVEWDVAILHMRVRANLTDDESRKIADFLKTAN